MKKILLGSSIVALLSVSSGVFADDTLGSVATLDRNQILSSTSLVDDAKKELENDFKGRKESLEKKQKDIMASIDEYSKNRPTMKKDAQESTEKGLIEKRKSFMAEENKFQTDFSNAQVKKLKSIEEKIHAAAVNIASDKKLETVLDKAAVVYSKKLPDITSEVIAKLKKGSKSVTSSATAVAPVAEEAPKKPIINKLMGK